MAGFTNTFNYAALNTKDKALYTKIELALYDYVQDTGPVPTEFRNDEALVNLFYWCREECQDVAEDGEGAEIEQEEIMGFYCIEIFSHVRRTAAA